MVEATPPSTNAQLLHRELNFDPVLPVTVDRTSVEAQVLGLRVRLCQSLPVAETQLIIELSQFVRTWVRENVVPLDHIDDVSVWLAKTHYSAARKGDLERVHLALNGAFPSEKQRRKINTFVKSESYGDFKAARLINSRSDAVKVTIGPAIHAIEQQLFSLPIFAKSFKQPGSLVEHIANAPKGCTMATDFTAFEAHMIPAIMEAVEMQLYRHCLSKFPDLCDFLTSTICGKNNLSTRQGVHLTLSAKRMSGDMNTSLGNSFTNAMVTYFVAHKSNAKILFSLFEGDDGLLVTEKTVDESIYRRVGFLCKAVHVDDPTHASFCGKVFAESRQVIRDHMRVVQTLGWSDAMIGCSENTRLSLLKARGMSLAFETPHCPIVRALADRAIALAQGRRPRYISDGYHVDLPCGAPQFDPSPSTRALFNDIYGISPEAQIQIEQEISAGNYTGLYSVIVPTAGMLAASMYSVT